MFSKLCSSSAYAFHTYEVVEPAKFENCALDQVVLIDILMYMDTKVRTCLALQMPDTTTLAILMRTI